jgi:hypothetical protein
LRVASRGERCHDTLTPFTPPAGRISGLSLRVWRAAGSGWASAGPGSSSRIRSIRSCHATPRHATRGHQCPRPSEFPPASNAWTCLGGALRELRGDGCAVGDVGADVGLEEPGPQVLVHHHVQPQPLQPARTTLQHALSTPHPTLAPAILGGFEKWFGAHLHALECLDDEAADGGAQALGPHVTAVHLHQVLAEAIRGPHRLTVVPWSSQPHRHQPDTHARPKGASRHRWAYPTLSILLDGEVAEVDERVIELVGAAGEGPAREAQVARRVLPHHQRLHARDQHPHTDVELAPCPPPPATHTL